MRKMRSDFNKKIEKIKEILQKYNGIPSQQVDKPAYATVSYFLKSHGDVPEIKALIEEYHLLIPKRDDYDSSLKKTESILKEFGRFPTPSLHRPSYQYVKSFFDKYGEAPDVEKLMYVYAYNKCFPLQKSMNKKPASSFIPHNTDPKYIIWRRNTAYEYVAYVFQRFGILPEQNTKPMEEVLYNINRFYEHNYETFEDRKRELYEFLKHMVDLGCRDYVIYSTYMSFSFMEDNVQQRVRQMLIENGCCSVRYISRNAIPGVIIPEKLVFFYYFIKSYCSLNYWEKPPVVRDFFKGVTDYSARMVYVNYRDYHLCNVDNIRKEAQANYKNWEENEPQSDDEWKAFGQWWFFAKKMELNQFTNEIPPMDWNRTIIDDAISRGISYFIFYNKWNYIDYVIFLIENNHVPKEDRMLEYFKDDYFYKNTSNEANVAKDKMRLKVLLKEKGIRL